MRKKNAPRVSCPSASHGKRNPSKIPSLKIPKGESFLHKIDCQNPFPASKACWFEQRLSICGDKPLFTIIIRRLFGVGPERKNVAGSRGRINASCFRSVPWVSKSQYKRPLMGITSWSQRLEWRDRPPPWPILKNKEAQKSDLLLGKKKFRVPPSETDPCGDPSCACRRCSFCGWLMLAFSGLPFPSLYFYLRNWGLMLWSHPSTSIFSLSIFYSRLPSANHFLVVTSTMDSSSSNKGQKPMEAESLVPPLKTTRKGQKQASAKEIPTEKLNPNAGDQNGKPEKKERRSKEQRMEMEKLKVFNTRGS